VTVGQLFIYQEEENAMNLGEESLPYINHVCQKQKLQNNRYSHHNDLPEFGVIHLGAEILAYRTSQPDAVF